MMWGVSSTPSRYKNGCCNLGCVDKNGQQIPKTRLEPRRCHLSCKMCSPQMRWQELSQLARLFTLVGKMWRSNCFRLGCVGKNRQQITKPRRLDKKSYKVCPRVAGYMVLPTLIFTESGCEIIGGVYFVFLRQEGFRQPPRKHFVIHGKSIGNRSFFTYQHWWQQYHSLHLKINAQAQ